MSGEHLRVCEISGKTRLPNDWRGVCRLCRTTGCPRCGTVAPVEGVLRGIFWHTDCAERYLEESESSDFSSSKGDKE